MFGDAYCLGTILVGMSVRRRVLEGAIVWWSSAAARGIQRYMRAILDCKWCDRQGRQRPEILGIRRSGRRRCSDITILPRRQVRANWVVRSVCPSRNATEAACEKKRQRPCFCALVKSRRGGGSRPQVGAVRARRETQPSMRDDGAGGRASQAPSGMYPSRSPRRKKIHKVPDIGSSCETCRRP